MPYIIQGESPPLPREPVQLNGVTYVPLRDLTETLGGSYEWDEEETFPSATIARWSAVLEIGSAVGSVNGAEVTFSAPIVSQDGTIWAPADFFYNAFGFVVAVDGKTVSITNPNSNGNGGK